MFLSFKERSPEGDVRRHEWSVDRQAENFQGTLFRTRRQAQNAQSPTLSLPEGLVQKFSARIPTTQNNLGLKELSIIDPCASSLTCLSLSAWRLCFALGLSLFLPRFPVLNLSQLELHVASPDFVVLPKNPPPLPHTSNV